MNSKEAERAELHKTIWRIVNDLRGSVDGWDLLTRDVWRYRRYFSTVALVAADGGNAS